jgi:hypothetical protein
MKSRPRREVPETDSDRGDRERTQTILTARLGHLGFLIDRHLQFHGSFPYDVLGHHTVPLSVDDVRASEYGIAAKVTVSIGALLDSPPLRLRRAGDWSPRRTEVKEFGGTVQIQARGNGHRGLRRHPTGGAREATVVARRSLISSSGMSSPRAHRQN